MDVQHQNCGQIVLLKGMEKVFYFRKQNPRKTQLLCRLLSIYLPDQKIKNGFQIRCITYYNKNCHTEK